MPDRTCLLIRRLAAGFPFLFLFLVWGMPLGAQSRKTWLEAARLAEESGNDYGAVYCYQKAYRMDPGDLEVVLMLAKAAERSRRYPEALQAWIKLGQEAPDFFPEARFRLAMTLKNLERYPEASEAFDRIARLGKRSGLPDTLITRSKVENFTCSFRLPALPPFPFPVTPVDSLNTMGSVYAPIQVGSGILFLQRKENDLEDRKNYLTWSGPRNERIAKLLEVVNSLPDHLNGFSVDSTLGLFVFSSVIGNLSPLQACISEIRFEGEAWTKPLVYTYQGLPLTGIQPLLFFQGGRKGIVFSSGSYPGKGGLDLFLAQPDAHGRVQEVLPFHHAANSPGNELSPYFNPRDGLFYFSSDLWPGYGGYDVFKLNLDSVGHQLPENLGITANSGADDLFFSISRNGNQGLLVSNRPLDSEGEETCCNNVFEFEIPQDNHDALNQNSKDLAEEAMKESLLIAAGNLLPLDLFFDNDMPNPKSQDTTTLISYDSLYAAYALRCAEYIEAWSGPFEGRKKRNSGNDVLQFFEGPLAEGYTRFQLFRQLVAELSEFGVGLEIGLSGHSSPLNDDGYNLNLSKRRVASVRNALLLSEALTRQEGSAILIREAGLGEVQIPELSDKLDDLRNSVFSPQACQARKVTIQSLARIE